jgi:NADH-quinone oxidoreductase subunit F
MERPLTGNLKPDGSPLSLAEYEAAGGYEGLRAALKMTPREVQTIVIQSNLRGRGGAGFVTGRKWAFIPMGPSARRPKYMIVNADEMEPGTMKDRVILEGDPHQLIEGTIIAAYAIESDLGYLFLRWAYKVSADRLRVAIAEAEARGYLGTNILGSGFNLKLHVHLSAGRYMCGEESALFSALEGKRATPRSKPPYAVTSGLWGKPTIVNNVETIACVPHILRRGADWFRSLGRGTDSGTKLYGMSGRVRRPGVWELPMGTPLREILYEHAGGMLPGHEFRGLLPGGASTNFLLPQHLDLAMDFDAVEKGSESRLGTGTMIVLDDRTCPVRMLISLEEFFARESCGWCTPCREGLPWVVRTLRAIEAGDGRPEDLDILADHTRWLAMHLTFCALAPGAIEAVKGALKYFCADLERHLTEKRCPWESAK